MSEKTSKPSPEAPQGVDKKEIQDFVYDVFARLSLEPFTNARNKVEFDLEDKLDQQIEEVSNDR